MTTPANRGFVIMACVLCLASAVLAAGAFAFHRAGTVVIRIAERGGDDIGIRIPAGLFHLALWLTPIEVIRSSHQEFAATSSAARAALRSVVAAPDGIYVQVDSPDETVRVAKERHLFYITVDSPDEKVEVRVPVSVMGTLLRRFSVCSS